MLKGETIVLINKVRTGEDPFHKPIYTESRETIENVLIAPAQEQEILDALNLTGRKAVYTLAIPKGDTHIWEDRDVEFFGHKWHTIGMPTEGIEEMIPLKWNRKVRVERYGEKGED